MRYTHIIATIGPASGSLARQKSMLHAGMNVARLNLSHGTHADHAALMRGLRRASKETKHPLAILADIQGPKIRLGLLPEEGVTLKKGERIAFSTTARAYKKGVLPVTYRYLHRDVAVGDRLLLDDGRVECRATVVRDGVIHANVVLGGRLTSHKGMNFPDTHLSLSSLTRKDRLDIQFAVKEQVDWMALSFAMRPEDVRLMRRMIQDALKPGQTAPSIIVKIEKHEALTRFDEILAEADGIMIARGDLGVEIPVEEVPVWQKELIDRTRATGKPVVVATQMLESMTMNPRPTRAEVSDVASAVFDQVDAVMLSAESASGAYPVAAVKMMASVIDVAEHSRFVQPVEHPPESMFASVSRALQQLAENEHIDGILIDVGAFPEAIHIGISRPRVPIFAATHSEATRRQLLIRWGMQPFVLSKSATGQFVEQAFKELKKAKLVRRGMRLAVLLGGEHGEGFDLITVP